jgi:integrase
MSERGSDVEGFPMNRKVDNAARGGRPVKGSIQWADESKTIPVGVRVMKAGGKRQFIRFDPGTTRADALALAPVLAERARHAVDENAGEVVSEYAKRWLADREARGIATVGHDRGRLGRHVLPAIGHLSVRTFDREAVERVVEDLDRKIMLDEDDEEHLSWKTASNVWVLVSKMCSDMADAKRRDLRVREDNPAGRVRPPERGEQRAKQYLYPSEFRRLVESQAIDPAFRALYAFAVYTYARSNELAALTWDDVDLDHGVIHITKSVDRGTRKVKSTKTGTTRRIPVEPELAPLLARLHAAREKARGRSANRVLWMPDHEDRAILLRQHLQTAGVWRAELFASDAQRKHITFHDLRATGITWCAVRGDDPLRIKQRAGHKSFSTTEVYIREAENLREGFGEPFPSLPPDLTEVLVSVLAFWRRPTRGTANFPWYGVEQRGIEPRTSALRTQRSPS